MRLVPTLERIMSQSIISIALAYWAEQYGVTLEFIDPANRCRMVSLRFNRSYREAVLDMFVFQSLSEVREQTEKWLREYNEERPHESLGNIDPQGIPLNPKLGSLYL